MFTSTYANIMKGFTSTITRLEGRAERNQKRIDFLDSLIARVEEDNVKSSEELNLCIKMADKMNKFLEV